MDKKKYKLTQQGKNIDASSEIDTSAKKDIRTRFINVL